LVQNFVEVELIVCGVAVVVVARVGIAPRVFGVICWVNSDGAENAGVGV
jgi:hypothetical protein